MSRLEKWLFLTGCMLALPASAGTAKLLDAAQLKDKLAKEQPCCVVDARSDIKRLQHPLAFSVVCNASLRPKAGGFAVVIGDSDKLALGAARTITRRSGEDAVAIKGGYATWQQLEQGGKMTGSASAATMPQRFTIPSNTCEQGPALQEYK
ncbi:hypothetical protein [Herbaspirillum sp. ST 5-3]|uniref:hypothetical protein n=1 Tax=Oxalobacteraceae TaxID=75682 RepID=UPI0010A2B357|nr:hypothetical protein [Herbaspirillum sp. ST 5-3]